MEVFIFCPIVVCFYNYKIQILEQIREELKLWQTIKVSALNPAFPQLPLLVRRRYYRRFYRYLYIISANPRLSTHFYADQNTNRQVCWKSIQNVLNSGNYLNPLLGFVSTRTRALSSKVTKSGSWQPSWELCCGFVRLSFL